MLTMPAHIATSKPKPPEEGFQIVIGEIKSGFEELRDVTTFFEKRVELELAYSQGLEQFSKLVPSQAADTAPLWQEIMSHLQQSLQQHKKYIDKGAAIVTELRKELAFQQASVDEIASDIYESFDEYKQQKEKLAAAEQEYKKRAHLTSSPTPSAAPSISTTISSTSSSYSDMPVTSQPCESEYREVVGSLERRRKVQVKLIKSAYCRFLELENARLQSIRRSFGAMFTIQGQKDQELSRVVNASLQSIKDYSVQKIVARYKTEWDAVMTLPANVHFKDAKAGPLPNLAFGVDLVDHLCITEALVSPMLSKAVKEIGYRGMDVKNLYSLKADGETLKKWCDKYEKDGNSKFEWESIKDLAIIVSMIKKYFADLPEPLFPYQTHPALESIAQRSSEDDRLQLLTKVIKALPAEHLNTLIFIMDHLVDVAAKSHHNRMDMPTLSQAFAPCLIRPRGSDGKFAQIVLMDLMRNNSLLLGNLPKPK